MQKAVFLSKGYGFSCDPFFDAVDALWRTFDGLAYGVILTMCRRGSEGEGKGLKVLNGYHKYHSG